ncbi:MAG: phosphotransferase [Patescibacteria group bacterium]|jgi:homoserine kinase type II
MAIEMRKTRIVNLLKKYRFGAIVGFYRIKKGFANTVIDLSTTAGRYILKIAERNNPVRVRYEVALLNFIRGLPTPRPIAASNGNFLNNYNKTNKAFIYKYLPGRFAGELTPARLRAAGIFLGKLHKQTRRFHSPIKRMEFYNITPQNLKATIKRIRRGRHQEVVHHLPYLEQNILKYVPSKKLPAGAMHIDFKPENALFTGQKLTGVVDFDNSYNGPLVLDLANTIMWFCSKNGRFNLKAALIIFRSYQSVRALNQSEKRNFIKVLHFAFLSHILVDMYHLALGKLPLGYIRWGIKNLLLTEKDLKVTDKDFKL